MRRRLSVLSTIALLPLALGACGGGDGSTAAPAAPTTTTTTTTTTTPTSPAPTSPAPAPTSAAPTTPAPAAQGFDVQAGPDGTVDPENWPDACEMLTDAEIEAIVPGVRGVERQGQHGSFLGGGETPHYVSCEHELDLPDAAVPEVPSTIQLDLRAVADPELVEERFERNQASAEKATEPYPDQYEEYGGSLGADDCYWHTPNLTCRTGAFEFWVGGRESGGDEEAQVRWREETLAQVVRALSEKMRG